MIPVALEPPKGFLVYRYTILFGQTANHYGTAEVLKVKLTSRCLCWTGIGWGVEVCLPGQEVEYFRMMKKSETESGLFSRSLTTAWDFLTKFFHMT